MRTKKGRSIETGMPGCKNTQRRSNKKREGKVEEKDENADPSRESDITTKTAGHGETSAGQRTPRRGGCQDLESQMKSPKGERRRQGGRTGNRKDSRRRGASLRRGI